MIKISILLPTYNCENTIISTLKSIKWSDEILVVDSFSNDSTLDIVKEYGVNIIQHEYINSAKQKNWAIQHCSNEWIFQIDSDEILEEKAEGIIRNAIKNSGENIHCFKMPRKKPCFGEVGKIWWFIP